MPVIFPDGTRAEVVYPHEFRLAEMGVVPYTSARLAGTNGRDFVVVRGGAAGWLDGSAPIAVYRGAEGATVELWRSKSRPPAYRLVFRFGSWFVLVWDGDDAGNTLGEAERRAWAASLRGRETEDGFLVLDARPPLRLARFGEHAGPELRIGDLSPRAVLLLPGWCDGRRGRASRVSADFGSRCLPAGAKDAVAVHVYGDRSRFIEAVLKGLEIRRLRPNRR